MHAHWPSVLSDEPWIWVGFLIAFVGLGLLEWLEQRSRLADLGVRGISTLWAPSLLVGAGWMAVVTTGNPFSFIWFIVLMLPTVGHPKPGPAAEGALQQRIKELGRKARVRISDPHTWSWGETNACIVHDTFRWWPATATSVSYIFVPLRFLGWMSRGEIDALVARRFRAKRPQGKSQLAFITVVVYAVAAATVLYWLHVDPRTHWFVPILLVAIEVGVLSIFWPRISLEAHLRAIQITGDAEPTSPFWRSCHGSTRLGWTRPFLGGFLIKILFRLSDCTP